MDFLTPMLGPMLEKFIVDLSPARMLEAVVLLFIIWRKLSPHLTKIENRIAGLESAVRDGFKTGESRFEKIENRVLSLENLNISKRGI